MNIAMWRVRFVRRAAIPLCVLLAWCPRAFGLDPALDVSQYGHSAWKIREGFLKTQIYSIAQTADGYLWLGTASGLFRFDGARPVSWKPPVGEQLPSDDIRKLLATHDGGLWIGTTKGLASWKDGKLTRYPELDGQGVVGLLQDRDGTIWAGGTSDSGRLCAIEIRSSQCFGGDGSLGRGVYSLYEDKGGVLWVVTPRLLWRWKPGPPKPYPIPGPVGLVQSEDGALLVLTGNGVRRIIGEKDETYPIFNIQGNWTPTRLLSDRNNNLWIGSLERGLLHVHQGRADPYGRGDGLSANWVTAIFEDRESNVWVATFDGLDRFRNEAVATLSPRQGLSDAPVNAVLVARDGNVWLSTYDGLNRWKDGELTIYRKRGARTPSDHVKQVPDEPGGVGVLGRARVVREITNSGLPDDYVESLFQDDRERVWVATRQGVAYYEKDRFIPVSGIHSEWVYSFAEDSAGSIWISQAGNLVHLLEGTVVEQIPWARLGRKLAAQTLLADSSQGDLWIGFQEGGLVNFKNGQVRASFTTADGLGKGVVSALRFDSNRALWAATEGGLSRVKDHRVVTLTSKNGLPCDKAHWSMEDNDRSLWLYMACGLVRIQRTELDAWVVDPKRKIEVTLYDASDGVRSVPNATSANPIVAKTADGKLWFLPNDGVSVIDPRHLPVNKLPPLVHIEQVTADRETYDALPRLRLPPLIRDLEIDYTALSLVAPEKNQFRYMLEGHDRDWESVGNRRQAFYNDLPPGNYRFRVIASNNSGIWNEQGAALDFSIAPAYWQTTWFRGACVAAFLVLLQALYQLRLRQIRQAFNARMEERVSERTRLARDLHDTLLQSFQGLLLRFQTALELLRTRPAEAEKVLQSAIDQTAHAITEGREAVQGLRASTVERNDLAQAIMTLGEEIAAEASSHASVELRGGVEGTPRTLHPIVRDEIYRIGSEALRNAFRHAEAKQIEVELRYDERQLRLRVGDDGKGIDPNFLTAEGRAGHFGLHGMRERAKLIGGKLTVWTALGSGTEIELSVPAVHAYAASSAPWRSWFTEKFSAGGRRRGPEEPSQSDSDSVA